MWAKPRPSLSLIVRGCSFTCGTVCVLFAAAAALQALDAHASPAGSILCFVLAGLSLFVAFCFLAVGVLYRSSLDG